MTTTTHLPATFTFAPTVNLDVIVAAPDYALAHAVDHAMNAFNMHMFGMNDYAHLRPVSDALYDLFTALETGAAGVAEIAALYKQLHENPCRYDAGMQDLILALGELVNEHGDDDEDVSWNS